MLSDRVIIITGGATELGSAIAMRCAEEDAYVVVADPDQERGAEIVEKIESAGGDGALVTLDIASEDSIQTMVGDAVLSFGSIHGLVICRPFEAIDDGDEDGTARLTGFCSEYASPYMKQAGGGSVVTAVSQDPLGEIDTQEALRSFTSQLARDMGEHNIRVNAVRGGILDTASAHQRIEGKGSGSLEGSLECQPLKRMGRCSDVANAVAFLLSDQAAHITGEILSVDGGRSITLPTPDPQ